MEWTGALRAHGEGVGSYAAGLGEREGDIRDIGDMGISGETGIGATTVRKLRENKSGSHRNILVRAAR